MKTINLVEVLTLFLIISAPAHSATLHAPCVLIDDYGGDPTNTNYNDTAFQQAVNAASTNARACVKFGVGQYKFSSQISYSIGSNFGAFSLTGSGSDVTELIWPSNGGIIINFNSPSQSAHIKGLALLAGASSGGNPAILLKEVAASVANPANSSQSTIDDVTARGTDGSSNVWTYGVRVQSVSNVTFTADDFVGPPTPNGTGVSLEGSSTAASVVYNFFGCSFNYNYVGLNYGGYTQGVSASNSNFTGGEYGILSGTASPGPISSAYLEISLMSLEPIFLSKRIFQIPLL